MKILSKRFLAFTISLVLIFTGSFCSAFAVEADETDNYYEQVLFYENLIAERNKSDASSNSSDWFSSSNSTQDLDSYNYLKNYLIKYGTKSSSSNSYYLSILDYGDGATFFFSITYNLDDNELYCGSIYDDNDNFMLYTNLDFDTNETDGYEASSVADHTDIGYRIYGFTTVYPSSYTDTIKMVNVDSYGDAVNSDSLDSLINSFFNISLKQWNSILSGNVGINLGNFGFTQLYTAEDIPGTSETYKVTYDANGGFGAPVSQQKNEDESIMLSTEIPTKAGYRFVGWSTVKNSTDVEYMPGDVYSDNSNIVLYAVWAKEADTPIVYPSVVIVNNPGTTQQSYGVQLALTAKAVNMPSDAQLVWYMDGQRSTVTGENCYVTCRQNCIVSVKIIDANGKVMLDADGEEISDSESINVNDGFFQRLIAFFKNLFFGTTVVYQ